MKCGLRIKQRNIKQFFPSFFSEGNTAADTRCDNEAAAKGRNGMKHIGMECLSTCSRTKFVPSYSMRNLVLCCKYETIDTQQTSVHSPQYLECKCQARPLERVQLTDFIKTSRPLYQATWSRHKRQAFPSFKTLQTNHKRSPCK